MRYPSILPPGYSRPRQIVANLMFLAFVGWLFWASFGRLGILMYHKYQEPHRLPTQEKLREEARSHNPAINQVYMKSLNLDMALNNAEMAELKHLFDPPRDMQRALVLQKLAVARYKRCIDKQTRQYVHSNDSAPNFEVCEKELEAVTICGLLTGCSRVSELDIKK